MASYLTDEVREQQYAVNRAKYKKLDRAFDNWLRVALGIGVVQIVMIMFQFGFHEIPVLTAVLGVVVILVSMAATVLVLYTKQLYITAAAMLLDMLFGKLNTACMLQIVVLIAAVILIVRWQKLAEQEGFPLFDISYAEMSEKMHLRETLAKNRAVAEGVRTEFRPQREEMYDILDPEGDAPMIQAPITGYHDRGMANLSADSVTAVQRINQSNQTELPAPQVTNGKEGEYYG